MILSIQKTDKIKLALFTFTLFLSAAMMFGLQPMIGKTLLPIVGGTPSGWIVAMAFFQVMLLMGYFLAYALSRFSPRIQGILYLLCLGGGIFFLPISLTEHNDLLHGTPEAFDVFRLLTATVAVPFIALSATVSTIQRLFMTTGHPSAKDPYFLYAASNLGSFAGLLLYPFLVEPHSTLTSQFHGWLLGYILLIGMTTVCLMASGKKTPAPAKVTKPSAPVSWKKRLEWICLSFLPSALLLAVTTHITTDIFSAPLLWMMPLGVYLLTFVVAFSKKPLVSYDWITKIQPVAVAAAIFLTLQATGPLATSLIAAGINLLAFGIVALMCHMRLAHTRPVENPQHLTEFYLMLAIGGALGGVLVAFGAPALFDRLVEYPLLMAASGLLNKNIRLNFSKNHVIAILAGLILIIILSSMNMFGMVVSTSLRNTLLIASFILFTLHPKMSVRGGIAIFLAVSLHLWQQSNVLTERNFYGIIKVYDGDTSLVTKTPIHARYMQHGTTVHGFQLLGGDVEETTPTAYYNREGPLGDIFSLFNPRTVAAVGLGTGTINCYSMPEREITFFEIDPAVVKMAKEQFTYLSKCGSGMPRIIVGDARLELKKLENEKFDLIILDAFSSDVVPTHLLTREAIELYLQHLNPGGVILLHISNRHFHLEGPIAITGKVLGLQNTFVLRAPTKPYALESNWMLLAPPDINLIPLNKGKWTQVKTQKKIKPWTDDYTDLLDVMDF